MNKKLLERYIEFSELAHEKEEIKVTNKFITTYDSDKKLDMKMTHNELLRNPIFIEVIFNKTWTDRKIIEELHNNIPELEKFIIHNCK